MKQRVYILYGIKSKKIYEQAASKEILNQQLIASFPNPVNNRPETFTYPEPMRVGILKGR